MPFTHRVRRPWGGQNPVKTGQLVDATSYRNLTQLEKLLYITPLSETEAAEANAMPPTDDPLKEHVVPIPDEPRATPGPPPPPPEQRPATPAVEAPPPPADQRPARPPQGPPPPKDQTPARTPNDETVDRDDAEEARRGKTPAPAPGPAKQHPDAHRAEQERLNPPRRRLPE
jgi:hypothetical protein